MFKNRRKSINNLHIQNQDLYFEHQPISSHQQFMNFLRDHEAWEYRRKLRIKKSLEDKEEKMQKELTFTPDINKKSRQLIPIRSGSVETRLLKQAQDSERVKEDKRIAQEFSFKPNIYSRRGSRVRQGNNQDLQVSIKKEIPPLPPRDKELNKIKMKYKEHHLKAMEEAKAEKDKIKGFSPVLKAKRGYHSSTR